MLLALLLMAAMWGEISTEIYFRFVAAVAIVVGLETVSLPILMKLGKEAVQKREQLVLEKLEDGTFRDSEGTKYQVKELDPVPDS